MMTLVLDIGSSSVRALLFDENLRTVAEASRNYRFETEPAGASTIEVGRLQSLTEACIDEILRHPQTQNRNQTQNQKIAVVGIDTFAGNLLGVDAQGRAITPIFSYADTRCTEDVNLLRGQIDLAATHQRTGVMHHTAYWPTRLHWLRRTDPEIFNRVTHWLDFGAYLHGQWFGEAVSSYSLAAWNGLLNREKLGWDAEWLRLLKMDEAVLPKLADYDNSHEGLKNEYATRWPALKNVPFTLAVGDGAAANIGAGAVDENKLALTVGTTAAMRVVIKDDTPSVPMGLWSYRVNSALHLTGGATSEGGNIYQWVRQTFAIQPELIESELKRRQADEHGLTFLPLLAGERSPGWAADATGAVMGLRLSTTPLDVVQAALEGVALRLSLIVEQLKPLVRKNTENIEVVGGGGALEASPAWAQIIANAMNLPLHLTVESEITARGTAILARAAIGAGGIDDFPPKIARTLTPQSAAVEKLAVARARQVVFYKATLKSKSSP